LKRFHAGKDINTLSMYIGSVFIILLYQDSGGWEYTILYACRVYVIAVTTIEEFFFPEGKILLKCMYKKSPLKNRLITHRTLPKLK
jgi:hypothetical protein